jgi:hypothetical protein
MMHRITSTAAIVLIAVSGLFLPGFFSSASAAFIVNGVHSSTDPMGGLDDVKHIGPCEEKQGFQRFTDYTRGYSICLPAGLTADVSMTSVRNTFAGANTRIDIYYDNFAGSIASPGDYVAYSNRFVANHASHTSRLDQTVSWNGRAVRRLQWERDPLLHVKGDLPHYASLEITASSQEVYSIYIKASSPVDFDMDILSTFKLIERRGAPGIYRTPLPSKTRLNKETAAFRTTHLGPDSPLRWGLFDTDAPERLQPLQRLENRLGIKFLAVLRYQTFDEQVPVAGLQNAYRDGRIVELTFHTIFADAVNALYAGNVRTNQTIMYDILNGKYDEYFREYARLLREFGRPVLFRLNNEMNGDWCWYSAFYTGKDPSVYISVWRHLHKLFADAGVENVLWVWNPHDVSLPAFAWNHPLNYYPGDEYVDIIGLTGYNTGTYFPGETWRDFHDIYKPMVVDYSNWFDKPFMITEFGSSSFGGDKPAWIKKMFEDLPQYPRIKLAVWWSGIDYDQAGRPGRIYLLDENEATVNAFRAGLKK